MSCQIASSTCAARVNLKCRCVVEKENHITSLTEQKETREDHSRASSASQSGKPGCTCQGSLAMVFCAATHSALLHSFSYYVLPCPLSVPHQACLAIRLTRRLDSFHLAQRHTTPLCPPYSPCPLTAAPPPHP